MRCAWLVVVLLSMGCVKKGPAEICESDGECESDLSCLAVSVSSAGNCSTFSQVCTQSCVADADCAELGDDFRCFAGCEGASICGQAEVKTTDLPASAVCETTDACATGLSCLPVSQHNGEMCTEVGMACSTTCTDDADCAEYGANFRCFEGCGAESVCGATG